MMLRVFWDRGLTFFPFFFYYLFHLLPLTLSANRIVIAINSSGYKPAVDVNSHLHCANTMFKLTPKDRSWPILKMSGKGKKGLVLCLVEIKQVKNIACSWVQFTWLYDRLLLSKGRKRTFTIFCSTAFSMRLLVYFATKL